jgi:hypothetical protein
LYNIIIGCYRVFLLGLVFFRYLRPTDYTDQKDIEICKMSQIHL